MTERANVQSVTRTKSENVCAGHCNLFENYCTSYVYFELFSSTLEIEVIEHVERKYVRYAPTGQSQYTWK